MKILLTYLLLLMMVLPASATPIDSLLQLPLDSLKTWLDENLETEVELYPTVAYHILNRVLEEEDYDAAAAIHAYLSDWNYINYEINGKDTIIYHRLQQIDYDSKTGNLEEVGKGYLALAIDYADDYQYKKAQEILFQSLEISESLNDKITVADVHGNLAELYNKMNQPDKALYFSGLSLPILLESKEYFLVATTWHKNYESYLLLGNYPKALEAINRAIKICTDHDIEQREYILIESYGKKGNIYLAQKEFDTAQSFFNKAWQLSKEHMSEATAETYRYNIGNAFFLQEKYEEALPHLLAGSSGFENTKDFDASILMKLSTCYEQLGQYKNALKYRDIFTNLEKHIAEDRIANLESETMVKYETGRKDQELSEQAKVIQQKNWIQALSLGAVILLVALLSSLFYFFRKNQKTNELLLDKNNQIEERNQQNELLLKEIHHRVKNNLQTISSLLSLQSRSITDKGAFDAVQESRNRVTSMALIHQKLYQGENLAAVEMRDYFETIGNAIINSFGEKAKNVSLEIDMSEIELDVDTAIPVGLITNELITNSIKHAFLNQEKGQIQITLTQEKDDLLTLKIADDGQASINESVAKKEKGFGTMLVQLLTTQLGGQLEKTTSAGTSTVIHFPRQEKLAA